MITPAHVEAIEAAAVAAVGGPERRCQFMVASIYKQAGLFPADLEIPSGNRDWAAAEGRSLIIPWVEASGLFDEVSGQPQPGDLLGFRLGRVLHHVAIALSGGRMIHVFGAHGPQIAVAIPDPWLKRLEKTWRIKA
jgi:cell wall-associated NlpC family hydrolase